MIRFSPFINDYSSNGIPLIRMKPQPILKEIGVQFKKESKIFVTLLHIHVEREVKYPIEEEILL